MIKSSFKKIQKKGTDTSAIFGHPQLDAVLRNNLKKGHLLILEQDHPTTIHTNFLRYFVSSNYHKSLYSLVFQSNGQRWYSIIPSELKEKIQKNQSEKSQIAWRYDNQAININTLAVNQNIPYMDLSKNIPQEKTKKYVKAYDYPEQLALLYSKIQEQLMNTLNDSNDTALRKVVLTGFPEQFLTSKDFQKFLKSLRCLARASHLLILLTVREIKEKEQELRDALISYSDYYMKINSSLGEAYSHFDGTLALIKQVQVGSVDLAERGITVWGIKSKSKKEVRIEPLYQKTLEEEGKKQQHPCGVTAKETLEF